MLKISLNITEPELKPVGIEEDFEDPGILEFIEKERIDLQSHLSEFGAVFEGRRNSLNVFLDGSWKNGSVAGHAVDRALVGKSTLILIPKNPDCNASAMEAFPKFEGNHDIYLIVSNGEKIIVSQVKNTDRSRTWISSIFMVLMKNELTDPVRLDEWNRLLLEEGESIQLKSFVDGESEEEFGSLEELVPKLVEELPIQSGKADLERQLLEPGLMYLVTHEQLKSLMAGAYEGVGDDLRSRIDTGGAFVVARVMDEVVGTGAFVVSPKGGMTLIPGPMSKRGVGPREGILDSVLRNGTVGFKENEYAILQVLLNDGVIHWNGVPLEFFVVIPQYNGKLEISPVPPTWPCVDAMGALMKNQRAVGEKLSRLRGPDASVGRFPVLVWRIMKGVVTAVGATLAYAALAHITVGIVGGQKDADVWSNLDDPAALTGGNSDPDPDSGRVAVDNPSDFPKMQAYPDVIPPEFDRPMTTILAASIETVDRDTNKTRRSASLDPFKVVSDRYYGGKFVPQGFWVPPAGYDGPLVFRFAVRGEKSGVMTGNGDKDNYKTTTLADAINLILDAPNISDPKLKQWLCWTYKKSFGVDLEEGELVVYRNDSDKTVQRIVYNGKSCGLSLKLAVEKDGRLRAKDDVQQLVNPDETDGKPVLALLTAVSPEISGKNHFFSMHDLLVWEDLLRKPSVTLEFRGEKIVISPEELAAGIRYFQNLHRRAIRAGRDVIGSGKKAVQTSLGFVYVGDPVARKIVSIFTAPDMDDGEKVQILMKLVQAAGYSFEYNANRDKSLAEVLIGGGDCNQLSANAFGALMAAAKIDFAIAYGYSSNDVAHALAAVPRSLAEKIPGARIMNEYAGYVLVELTGNFEVGDVPEVEVVGLHTYTFDKVGQRWIVWEIEESSSTPKFIRELIIEQN